MNINLSKIRESSFLITGGAGFIGSHIAEFLVKNSARRVVVFDNLSTGFESNISHLNEFSNFEFFKGDITNVNDCLSACEGIDFVSHQAALGSVPRSIENPLATHEANATGFLNILMACKEKKVKRIVYASSSSVYGDISDSPKTEDRIGKPLSPYAVSKLVNEQYASIFSSTYSMQIIGLRYFNVFGPRQNPQGAYAAAIPLFIHSILKNEKVFINGNGEQSRDFTYVDNAVQANISSLLLPFTDSLNSVFNIACGKSISVNEMYSKISILLKSNNLAHYREQRLGDVMHSKADITKSQKYLNYQPSIDFEKGIQITVDWFKNLY